MALVLADRVRDTTTTTGTGTVTLSGTAPTGYQNFSVVGNGNTTYYTINAGSQWEVGIGTYSSTGPTLARTTVLASSNSGSLVDFSTGTKDVFVTYPAEEAVYQDGSSIKAGTAILGVPNGGTGVTTSTGTVAVVLSNSPTLVTPVLGAASATSIANALGAVGTPSYTFTGDTNTGIFSPAADTLAFVEGGVEAMRIDSSGNVGIGTSSPSSRLTITGGNTEIRDGNYLLLRPSGNAWDMRLQATGTQLDILSGGALGSPIMSLLNGGNVGIGTSSPGSKLDVVAQDAIRATGFQPFLTLRDSSDSNKGSRIQTASAITIFYNDTTGGGTYTERMRIDSSGNVGIGTASPSAKLDVNGDLKAGNTVSIGLADTSPTIVNVGTGATGNKFAIIDFIGDTTYTDYGLRIGRLNNGANGTSEIQHRGTGALNLNCQDAGTMTFATNATERMRIDSSGNLLVGGTTALGKIHLQGDVNGNIDTWIRNDNSGSSARAGIVLNAFGNSWRMGVGSSANNGNALTWNVDIGGANTERMRIDTSGNLGVGTSAPKTRLQATAGGSLNAPSLGSATNAPLYVTNTDSAYGLIAGVNSSDGHVFLQAQRTDGTATAYNLTLNEAGGNVLVGTTTINNLSTGAASNPGFGVAAGQVRSQWNADANAYWSKVNVSSSTVLHDFYVAGTRVGVITTNGSTTTYGTSSDVRLKDNIADADNASSLIDAIQVRKFDWKADGSHQRYGFVAQELLEVAPEAVTNLLDPDEMMGVDYSKLVPMLVKEIQSLRARVAQLEGN